MKLCMGLECVQHPVTLSLFLLIMNFLPILVIALPSRKKKKVASITKHSKAVKQLLAVVCFDKDL